MGARSLYITNLGLLDNLAKTQVLPYLEGLVRNGVSVHILSFEKRHNLEDKMHMEKVSKRLSASNIRWTHLLYHNRWGNLLDIVLGFAKALEISKKEKIGIVHARASIPILIAWPLAKLLKIKIIYDRRGTMAGDFVDDVNVKNIFSMRVFSNILDGLDAFFIRHSDAVIVLSGRALDILKGQIGPGAERPALVSIPCCADLAKFGDKSRAGGRHIKELEGKFIVSYLGSLGTCYLLREMADFFKELKRMKPDSVFLIISHTDAGYIERTLNDAGLARGTDFVILEAEPDEVPALMSKSDCSIMFIKPVECKIGSSPTKFGESLAAGVPVVVNSGIGDTEKIISERRVGVVVGGLDSASYEKAAKELSGLMAGDGLDRRCIDAARDYFSLELGVRRYVEVYEKVERS